MNKSLIFSSHSEDIQKFEWGEVIWIHEPKCANIERLSVGLVKIFPKSKHVSHLHFGEEQILYTLQGKGIHKVNNEEKAISQGMVLHCPPYSEHEVINTEDIELIFMIVYTPAQLIDFQPNLSQVSRNHILDYIDIELLKKIQEDVSNLLQLSVKITDAKKSDITRFANINSFCTLCPNLENCEKEPFSMLTGSLGKTHEVYVCSKSIIVFWIPILVKGDIIGYIKCGHLLISRPIDIEEKIFSMSQNIDTCYDDLLRAYNALPLVPKSRLYALEELLIIASKYITGIIENSIVVNELKEKNNEILEKTQEKIDLENALKEANSKLLKYQTTSNFNIINYRRDKKAYVKPIQYPFRKEIELENHVKLLDRNTCSKIINQLIEDYKKDNMPIDLVKNVFDELICAMSRIIYKETNNIEMLSQIRQTYKSLISTSHDYFQLEKCVLDYLDECIEILRKVLENGSEGIINQVNNYIKENYYQDLTLKSIAEKFFISPNYLSKIFNERNKISLTDYINKVRIEKAKHYLLKTNMKISLISKRVGCSNISYFSHIFKKMEKCTPKEYRLNLRDQL